jgi:hypothetical protein
MGQSITDELVNRVRRLETQLRWQRRFLAVLIAVSILSVVGIAAGPSDTLRAKSFLLVDDDGKLRASIVVNQKGGAAFNILSTKWDIQASLGNSSEGDPFLALYGKKNGKLDVKAFMALSDGEPSLQLRDKNGKTLFSAIRKP